MDSIECNGAHLTLETSKPGKLPLEFAIAHMKLTDVSAGGSMHFDAELTNPRPAGTILTSGSMGPWVVDDPGETPVAGDYRFEHADLGVFKGIAGILNSTGKYQGVLRDLVVDGQTDTPDFRLTHFGTAMPLHTEFHAHVDGTNGDTWLQPVDATLGQSHFTAEGKIVRVPPETLPNGTAQPGGHEIALNVNVDRRTDGGFSAPGEQERDAAADRRAGAEDHARNSAGNGAGGRADEAEREFCARRRAFTSAKIQNDVGELEPARAGRAEGCEARRGTDVRSAMQSDFTMAGGVITLPDLKYTVPGAEIDLKGTYGVDGGSSGFHGNGQNAGDGFADGGRMEGSAAEAGRPVLQERWSGDGGSHPYRRHARESEVRGRFRTDEHTSPQMPGQTQ